MPTSDPIAERIADALAAASAAIAAELDGVRDARDAEHIHRCRVACRRARAALALATELAPELDVRPARRTLRRLGRALGAARDADVQLQWLGHVAGRRGAEARTARRLARRLRRRRDALQPEVRRAVRRARRASLAERLDAVAAALRETAGTAALAGDALRALVDRRLVDVQAAADAVDLAQDETLHALRIALKHLRYALEPLAGLLGASAARAVGASRELQRRLGAVQDACVRADVVGELAAREARRCTSAKRARRLERGVLALGRRIERERVAARAEFEAQWRQLGDGAELRTLATVAHDVAANASPTDGWRTPTDDPARRRALAARTPARPDDDAARPARTAPAGG